MTFREEDHPRAPSGTREGGQFSTGAWHDIDENDFTEKGNLDRDGLNEVSEEYLEYENLSEYQIVAAQDYTGRSFEEINATLRAGEDTSDYADTVSGLDEIFERSHVTEDVAVFRGVSDDFASKLATLKAGDRLNDAGFISTSFDQDVGANFAERGMGEGKMKILLPKGTPAYVPAKNSQYYEDEDEVILPRGGNLRFLRQNQGNFVFVFEPSQ